MLFDGNDRITMSEQDMRKQVQGIYQMFYERNDEGKHSVSQELADLSIKNQARKFARDNNLEHLLKLDDLSVKARHSPK